MSMERMVLKGRLVELKNALEELQLAASGRVILIRQLINPYLGELEELKTGEALEAMHRLHEDVQEMKALKKKIAALREELGGE